MAVWLAEMMNREHKNKRRGSISGLGGDETLSSTYPEGFIPSGWVSSSETEYKVSHQAIDTRSEANPTYC